MRNRAALLAMLPALAALAADAPGPPPIPQRIPTGNARPRQQRFAPTDNPPVEGDTRQARRRKAREAAKHSTP